jgi:hypothetical protein
VEEKKMAKERTRDDVEWELEWEKKQKKILLICSAIFCGLGIIGGVAFGIAMGSGDIVINIIAGVFVYGVWLGTGIGGAISYIPHIPHMFKQSVREGGGCLGEGCFDSVTGLLKGILIWLVIFSVLGPVGLLIRFLLAKHKIKQLEKELSGFGQ